LGKNSTIKPLKALLKEKGPNVSGEGTGGNVRHRIWGDVT